MADCPPGVDCMADSGSHLVAGVSPVLALAVVAVLARLYSRHLTGQRANASDYTVIVGLVISASLTGMIIYTRQVGLGRHVAAVPPQQLESLLITLYVGCILYAVAMAIIKISILLLYRSLFPTSDMRLATTIIGAISIAWGTETAMVGVFSCNPVRAFWDMSVTQKKCINTTVFFIANSALHVVIDIAILTLPVRKVLALKMPRRKKVLVSFMFLLGGFICIIGILRLFFLATLKMADPTYSLVDTYVWSSVEANVGIICACLPTLRPLFMKLFPSGGFESQKRTITPVHPEYGINTPWARPHRHSSSFAPLREHNFSEPSPKSDSKTWIHMEYTPGSGGKANGLRFVTGDVDWRDEV